jgi:transcriptional regulator with GAF, ATPase, and Fis domain
MMNRDPWLHFWGADDPSGRKAIVECLNAAGIAHHSFEQSAESGEGILCIPQISEQISEDVCVFLHELTRNGRRVLTIQTGGAAADTSLVWQLLHAGASDVLVWSQAADVAARIKARLERWNAIDALIQSPPVQDRLIGVSAAWRAFLRRIVEVARFTQAFVVLIGESGTGKELIARLIHELSPKVEGAAPIVLDCTTIVPELSGSEFFGHERGAFTGAVSSRDGAFAAADGGTLFLDEVGELPMPLQAQLLRVMQEGTYKRVGGNVWRHTEFRLVCATNRDLLALIERGQFRSDLYYRIASWVFRVPSLQERREDILPLARYFLRTLRPDMPDLDFEPAVCDYLLSRAYPGNVRDLRQLIARIGNRHVGPGSVTAGDIPSDEVPVAVAASNSWRNTDFEQSIRHALATGAGLKEISQAAADTAMRIAVDNEHGSLQRAAQRLGVTGRALQLRRAARRKHNGGPDGSDDTGTHEAK